MGGATWAWAMGVRMPNGGGEPLKPRMKTEVWILFKITFFFFCVCFILFFFPQKIFLQGEKTELHGKQQQQLVSVRACWQDWCSGPHR